MYAPAKSRENHAARQRVWRQRQLAGVRIARIAVDSVALAETLVAAKMLSASEADNDAKADAALSRVIADWLAR